MDLKKMSFEIVVASVLLHYRSGDGCSDDGITAWFWATDVISDVSLNWKAAAQFAGTIHYIIAFEQSLLQNDHATAYKKRMSRVLLFLNAAR